MAGLSDFFYEKLFNKDNKDDSTEFVMIEDPFLLNIHSTTLELIISFCYSKNIKLTSQNTEDLLDAASLLKIKKLETVCCNSIGDMMSTNNCLKYLQIAEKYNLNVLLDKAFNMISENLPEICRTAEFYRLDFFRMNWLLENLSKHEDGIYDDLLKSLKRSESEYAALMPELFNENETLPVVRSAVSI